MRTEPNKSGVTVVGMKEAVDIARADFVERLSLLLGLTNESGEAVETLPWAKSCGRSSVLKR